MVNQRENFDFSWKYYYLLDISDYTSNHIQKYF